MKKLLVLAAAVMMCGVAAAQNTDTQNYIEVTGKAEMEVVPDEIYVAITINEKDNKGKVSIDQQEKAMFRSLKDLGIDLEKDMTVQDMSSDLKTYVFKKNAVMTSKSYQLKVGSAALLGKVFQALAADGISDASVMRTDVSNLKELRQQVRAEAAKAARMNAETLAGALGQQAGPAIY
ncbi:MAG: SIMPL domain-containing protein, partial [Rikenellaceae bacterium]|nr:SIMPL domain-containing protein [Rikenellaceae bacterium]